MPHYYIEKTQKKQSISVTNNIVSNKIDQKEQRNNPKEPQNPPPFAGNQRLSPGKPGGQGENSSTEKLYDPLALKKAVEEKML